MIDLSVLPKEAQRELYDFYQFLVERYTKKGKKTEQSKTKENEINSFFDGFEIDLADYKFNRNEIYER